MSAPKRVIAEKQTKDKIQFVQKTTKFDKALSELVVLPYALIGGTFFVLLILSSFPTMAFGIFLFLWLLFPILLTAVVLFRNRILEGIFAKISHKGYLQFAMGWRVFPLFVIAVSSFWGLFVFRDPRFFLLSLTFLYLCMPFYLIFEHHKTID